MATNHLAGRGNLTSYLKHTIRLNRLFTQTSGVCQAQAATHVGLVECARVMMQLVENGYLERPINIGREETVSVKNLVKRVAEMTGLDVELAFDQSKPEGRFIKSADSKLLLAVLGDDFEWRVDLQDGLKRMVVWYHQTFKSL